MPGLARGERRESCPGVFFCGLASVSRMNQGAGLFPG